MRKLHLLSTAAVVLALGAGGAYAQSNKDQSPEKAPAAQRQAPAEKMGPAIKHSDRKAPETTGQGAPQKLEPGHGENTQLKQEHSNSPMDADSGSKGGVKSPTAMDRELGAKTETGSDAKADVKSEHRTTTGQGAAAGSSKLSTEQRGKITTIIRSRKVEPAHLSVSVRVGTRVPDSVHFYPLPPEVFVIYPEWRGYDYIMVGDEILVVDPRTHEIVAILDA